MDDCGSVTTNPKLYKTPCVCKCYVTIQWFITQKFMANYLTHSDVQGHPVLWDQLHWMNIIDEGETDTTTVKDRKLKGLNSKKSSGILG